ncbi:MAG TPA: hypothetical protein VFI31_03370 [Pirellulales bacterium]|nr:hypothetical protein [Pirellulales bacterium]
MSTPDDWAKAYARQADADFKAWELYQKYPEAAAAECHKLLFLQMACEKLCKAYVLRAGVHKPDDVQTSHGFIQKHLPVIMRQEIANSRRFPRNPRPLLSKIRQLCGEIEILNPSMKRGNHRPDNCEYPWEVGKKVVSPLDHTFIVTQLLMMNVGITFLKLLRRAIDQNL